MDILNLIGWRTAELERAAGSRLPDLKVGDRLQGRVARLLHQNLAVVDLLGGRFKAVAELKTPLDTGQSLNLEVKATTPRLTLQMLENKKGSPGSAPTSDTRSRNVMRLLTPRQVRQLITEMRTLAKVLTDLPGQGTPRAAPVSTALERLVDHLTPLDPRSDPEEMATRLRARVRDGGLLFEHKLLAAAQEKASFPSGRPVAPQQQFHHLRSDLKPQLQRLLIQLPALMETLDPEQALSTEGSRQLWSAVTALLDEIEHGQNRLRDHRPEDPPAVMRHGMWVTGRDKPLQFNVYLPRKGGRKGDPTANPMISLLLDLEHFGALRVDVGERCVSDRQGLGVNFWTESETVSAELQAASAPLVTILETLYPLVDLKIAPAVDKIAAFEMEVGATLTRRGDSGRLDIRI